MGTVAAGLSTSFWYVTRVVCGELRISAAGYLWNGVAIPVLCAGPAAVVAVLLKQLLPPAAWPALVFDVAGTAVAYALTFGAFALARAEREEAYGRLRLLRRVPAPALSAR
jgi:hypothetical protein